MAPQKSEISQDVRQILLRCLDAGQTGCVSATTDAGVGLAIYVMFGEVLAAHGADDDVCVLRVLQNMGIVTEARGHALLRRSEAGDSLSEILFEEVPDDLLLGVLQARFRENLFEFLGVSSVPEFEAMDSIFVENIQVGHDSRQLIAELSELRASVSGLAAKAGMVLAPGATPPTEPEAMECVELCTPKIVLSALLARAPWEVSRALELVAGLLESGALVGVASPGKEAPAARARRDAAPTDPGSPAVTSVIPPTDPGSPAPKAAPRSGVSGGVSTNPPVAASAAPGAAHSSALGAGGAPTGKPSGAPVMRTPPPATSATPTRPPVAPAPAPAAKTAAPAPSAPVATPAGPSAPPIASTSAKPAVSAPAAPVAKAPVSAPVAKSVAPVAAAPVPVPAAKPAVTQVVPPKAPAAQSRETLAPSLSKPPAASQRPTEPPRATPVPGKAPPVSMMAAPASNLDPKRTLDPMHSPVGRRDIPENLGFEDTEEIDLFADHDHSRGAEGEGSFVAERGLLDRVELFPATRPAAPVPDPNAHIEVMIEMEDAENASKEVLAGAVSLNFAGPKLSDEEARRKLEVVNEVLTALGAALDAAEGVGMGPARTQLLVEGTPGAFAALFKNVEVDETGGLPIESVLKNLRKRPASEHRRLLNRGLGDLIERALGLASESMDDATLETMLEKIAGYQQRLGI